MVYVNDAQRERDRRLIASCQDRMLAEAGDAIPCCGTCAATFPVAYRDDAGDLSESPDPWCDEHGWMVSRDGPACERYTEA